MPHFAANLNMLFTEVPFKARFALAADSGFRAVECLFPYAFGPQTIAAELRQHGLSLALFNLPPGDWAANERGIAALPGREAAFRNSVEQALVYATALDCKQLHVMAGIQDTTLDAAAMHDTYVANLRYAARRCASHNVNLLIEPINTRDMPGYFLNSIDQAAEIIAQVSEPGLYIQFDMYHAQIMGGDIWSHFTRHQQRIRHIQVASVPARQEPDQGELNYAWLFRRLDDAGYTGWVGCEYHPRRATRAGLTWMSGLNTAP